MTTTPQCGFRKWTKRDDWLEWLAWETSPLYGGFAHYIFFKLVHQSEWKGMKEEFWEFIATTFVCYLISVPILFALYFTARRFTTESRVMYAASGFVVGIVVRIIMDPSLTGESTISWFLYGLVGMFIGLSFHILAYKRTESNKSAHEIAGTGGASDS